MTAALVAIGSVQGVILLVQSALLALLLRTVGRVDELTDALTDTLADLRVDVGRIAQRLDDNVVDPGAHSAA